MVGLTFLVSSTDPAGGWSIFILVRKVSTQIHKYLSIYILFPFLFYLAHLSTLLLWSPVLLHLFPEWRMLNPSERVAEVVPSPKSPGYWGCSCSLDPTTGRLQRPSGEHWAVHESWDTCFWTYLLGCFTRGQLGSRREPRERWGGWREMMDRRSRGERDDIGNTWRKIKEVEVLVCGGTV